jgi:CRP-like cAMP-binding protein/cytochrome c-type biogenesis protein CcmH/NrfG
MSIEATSPLERDELTGLAKRFSDQGRYAEAAELFQLALRIDPDNLGIKLALAQLRKLSKQRNQKQQQSLREQLREEFRRNAIDAAQFLGLAHLYAEKGDSARAVECLEVAKAKDLANPAFYKLHGRLQFKLKDYNGAAEQLYRALRYNPFDREVSDLLGRVEYERQDYRSAIGATIDAFLLLQDGDQEGSERLKRRIRTLKQVLAWDNEQLVTFFNERQEALRTSFDRLEWHRERFFAEEEALTKGSGIFASATAGRKAGRRLELASRLRKLPLWPYLSDEFLFLLTDAMQEELYDTGNLIFGYGTEGNDIFVLEKGEINVQRQTHYGTFALTTLKAGDMFGEMNFVDQSLRSGDAIAAKPVEVLRIDAEIVERLVEETPELGVYLYWIFWHSLARKLRSTNELLNTFFTGSAKPEHLLELRRTQSGLAAANQANDVAVEAGDKIRVLREQGLSGKELVTLATFSREKRFPSGTYLFQEGDEGAEMYVILEGKALISKYIKGGGEEALAILERGDFFGEMSLIDGQPRSADARAYNGPLTVLALDQATIREVLALDPHASLEFLRLLCRLVAKRLREIDEKIITWRIMSGQRNEAPAR